MKKVIFTAATLALLTLFTSAYSNRTADARVGYQAPNFTFEQGDSIVSLQQFRGQEVIVTFWSTTAVQSRLDNMRHDREARTRGLAHISVNMDHSEGVYTMAVIVDRLRRSTQFHADSAQQQSLSQAWRLEKGYNSFLIGPDGRIEQVL